jgi:hypothetical protein
MKILRRINLVVFATATIAILLGTLNVINVFSGDSIWVLGISPDQLKLLTNQMLLIIIGLGTTNTIEILAQVGEKLTAVNEKNSIEGIKTFRPQRKGYLRPISETFALAQQDVLISGIGLGTLVGGHNGGVFDEPLNKNCTIRILFLSPYTPNGEPNPVVEVSDIQTGYTGQRQLILQSMENYFQWRLKLDKSKQKRLLVKGYYNIPSTAIVMIDAKKPNGFIRVEPIVPGIPIEFRPSFDVTITSSKDLFDRLHEAYENLWANAIDIEDILRMHRAKSSTKSSP